MHQDSKGVPVLFRRFVDKRFDHGQNVSLASQQIGKVEDGDAIIAAKPVRAAVARLIVAPWGEQALGGSNNVS